MDFPAEILTPGTFVAPVKQRVGDGSVVVIHSRGRYRVARVERVTETFAHCAYKAPGGGGTVTRPKVRHADLLRVCLEPGPDVSVVRDGRGRSGQYLEA